MPLRQARWRVDRTPRGVPGASMSTGSVIPFDHAATFALTGRPGNIVQDVIKIGVEGIFVAVAIGYGFEEERARSTSLGPARVATPPATLVPGDITLGEIPVRALIEGFRLNPRFDPVVFVADPVEQGVGAREAESSDEPIAASLARNGAGDLLVQRLKAPEEISFLFSIVDSGSGRELQDEPIHNLASLGTSNGERPFRPLAQPVTFQPRSTIRLQVIERSEGVRGTLFIVLYGYKVLAAGCPEPLTRSLQGPPICPTETLGHPSQRVIPFDYVARFQLTGRPGNRVDDEISVNVEGGYVATALGYGLAVEDRDVEIQWVRAADIVDDGLRTTVGGFAKDWRAWLEKVKKDPATAGPPPLIDLTLLPLRLFPTSALRDGIRVRREFVRIAFLDGGALTGSLPATLADRIFERLNRPEDVAFRYAISDSGRGVDLQNQPINNIAGLGIANGDRPFKRLVRPMVFLPRSTIKVGVEERFGRGTLFIVFQGYKVLGVPALGRRP